MRSPLNWLTATTAPLMILGLLPSCPLLAQGLISVSTMRPPGLGGMDGPLTVPIRDRDGNTYLYGSDYSAQLYAGPAGTAVGNLRPVGTPLSFGNGDGFLSFGLNPPIVVSVPDVPSGKQAQVQLRIWDNAGGSVTNWESAQFRGTSASFLSNPLAKSSGPAFQIPSLDGIRSFQLEPSEQVTGALDGVFISAYYNWHYRSQFFTPSATLMPWLSGDGRHLLTKFYYDSGKADAPELVDSYRERRAPTWKAHVKLPVVLTHENHYRHVAGVSSDASVIAINDQDDTPEAFLLVNGSRIELGIRHVTALSRSGRRVFGLTPAGDLVRFDWNVGETVVLKAGFARIPGFMQVSHDGSTAVVDRAVWRDDGGIVPVEVPASFTAAGLSGDGRTLVGSSQNRPASLSVHQLPFTLTLFGQSQGATGTLNAASFDGSVMCGSVTTPRGRWVVFTADGRGYKLNELLPGAGARLESYGATQISDDGRTIFGTNSSNIGDGSDGGWVADLVFPGDGPQLQTRWTPGGRPGVAFPTRVGYRYQLEHSMTFGPTESWSPHGPAIEGNGQELGAEFDNTGDTQFLRLLVSPLPR